MAQLRQDYTEFTQRGTEIVVVGPEGPKEFKKYWKDNNLPFTGLPDPSHAVLKLYGQQVNLFKFGRMPAQAVVDKAGIVRYVHYGKSMADIPDNDSLLDLLDQVKATKVNIR
jgi:peroxiredoxin Q/BCP